MKNLPLKPIQLLERKLQNYQMKPKAFKNLDTCKKIRRVKALLQKSKRINDTDNPYAPNFYVNDNVIGYTGNLGANPTIYYFSRTGNMCFCNWLSSPALIGGVHGRGEFGHVTMDHGCPCNVGRERVYERIYAIVNHESNGGNSVEWIVARNGWVDIHPSRNPFVRQTNTNRAAIQNETASFVVNFPTIKELYTLGRDTCRINHPGLC